jgi:hypothetical protein
VRRLTFVFWWAAGCRGYHDEIEKATWVNEGRLCIVPADDTEVGLRPTPPDDVFLDAGVALAAVVLFSTCEECVSEPTTGCEVHAAGELVEVTSSASHEILREDVCGGGCDPVSALCGAGTYGAGTVTFEHGGDLLPMELPFTGYPCVGEPVPPTLVGS